MCGTRSWHSWAGVCAVVFLLCAAAPVRAGDKEIMVLAEWGAGSSVEEDLKVLAPTDQHIGDEKEWAKLWTAWRGKQSKTPQVNFNEQVVLVVTSRDEILSIAARLDDKGNLTVSLGKPASNTFQKKSGEGWYYRLAVIKREGIKTVNGQPIKKGDTSPAQLTNAALQEITDRLTKLEQANAELRAAVERLQKEVEQLKKK